MIEVQSYKADLEAPSVALNDSVVEEHHLIRSSSFAKFTECTICLSTFAEGDSVKMVPNCNHVFHEKCFNDWVA